MFFILFICIYPFHEKKRFEREDFSFDSNQESNEGDLGQTIKTQPCHYLRRFIQPSLHDLILKEDVE